MAIRVYSLNANERAQSGFTTLFVVKTADLSSFSNFQVTLCSLAVGDLVDERILQEHKTLITGPSVAPTASVGITGTATRFTAASVVKSGSQYISSGSGVAPLAVNSATSLILDLQAGGGDGAAATAGEIWVWAQIFTAAERAGLKG